MNQRFCWPFKSSGMLRNTGKENRSKRCARPEGRRDNLRHKWQHDPRKVSGCSFNRRLGASNRMCRRFQTRKLSCTCRESNPRLSSPQCSNYTDYAETTGSHRQSVDTVQHSTIHKSSLNLFSFKNACKMRPVAYIQILHNLSHGSEITSNFFGALT